MEHSQTLIEDGIRWAFWYSRDEILGFISESLRFTKVSNVHHSWDPFSVVGLPRSDHFNSRGSAICWRSSSRRGRCVSILLLMAFLSSSHWTSHFWNLSTPHLPKDKSTSIYIFIIFHPMLILNGGFLKLGYRRVRVHIFRIAISMNQGAFKQLSQENQAVLGEGAGAREPGLWPLQVS